MSTLKVRDITKYYGNNLALRGANFDAVGGDFIGLLGANGAGK